MREIIFRGKLRHQEFNRQLYPDGWVEGYVFDNGDIDRKIYIGKFVIVENWTINDGKPWEEPEINGTDGLNEVIPDSVGEYTGLEDKNGRKIFEGDILQTGDRHAYRLVVKFGDYDESHIGFYAECPSEDFYRNDLIWWVCNRKAVVVGNLFDNPELVEGCTE